MPKELKIFFRGQGLANRAKNDQELSEEQRELIYALTSSNEANAESKVTVTWTAPGSDHSETWEP